MKTGPPFYLVESFLTFSQSSNMAEAGHNLGLSQPALSVHLRAFEDHFQQKVFTLVGRKKMLTPFGHELKILFAQKFGSLSNEINAIQKRHQSPEHISVRIAGRAEILGLFAVKTKFAGWLIFTDVDGASAVEGLIDRTYDLAISNHLEKAEPLHAKKLFGDRFEIVFPKKWLPDKTLFSKSLVGELVTRPYLAYKENDPRLESLLQSFKISERPKFKKVISNWPALLQMVEEGQGWSIAPIHKAIETRTLLRSLPLPASIAAQTDFFAIYRKESSAFPWFRDLVAGMQLEILKWK